MAGVLVVMMTVPRGTSAQEHAENTGQYEIASIDVEGNETVTTKELLGLMLTRETPGAFSKLLHGIDDRLGRKNEFFNPITFSEDLDRLRKRYHDRGFAGVRIDTSLLFDDEESEMEIELRVTEGYRSIVDTIAYSGIVNVPEFVYEDLGSSPHIVSGDPYDAALLEAEVARVRLILWNAGYPNCDYARDRSYATFRTSTSNYSVRLTFDLGKRYVFGDIRVTNEDSLRGDITDDIVLSQLDYKPNDFYNYSSKISSERNLNRVGIFDQARIETDVPPNDSPSVAVASSITVRPKDKHELAPELLISDENNAFNLGTGLGYTNRNFLGGARTFSTRLRFRTQTIREFPNYFGVGTDAVSNAELSFELQQPYIFTNKIKGNWTFSLIRDKQLPYRQDIVRNTFGFTDRFAEFTTGFLDWTLERVSLRRNPNFVGDTNDVDFLRQRDQLIEQEKNAQFNSILSFTIQRDKSNDLFRPSDGFIHTATIEEAGLLPLVLKNTLPKLPFTQFYRISLLGRWYFDLTDHRYSIFGLKLKAGFEDKYGETRSDTTRSIPQTHRFYAGGGGSIRGWQSRDLSATGDPQFGGNVSFEGTFELRMNILQSLRDDFLDKIWIVGFLDFGNVWGQAGDLQLKDVALATGIGFRYDTFFGPFRIDYGFRVYNPSSRSGQQWITERSFWGQTFKEGVFHFGIGHAF
jgi:outer membrane protein assembly factor BamA